MYSKYSSIFGFGVWGLGFGSVKIVGMALLNELSVHPNVLGLLSRIKNSTGEQIQLSSKAIVEVCQVWKHTEQVTVG